MGLARVVAEHSFGLIVFSVVLGLGIGVNCGGPDGNIPSLPDPVVVATPAPVAVEAVVIQPAPEPGGRGSNPGPTSAVIANDCSATLTNTGAAPHGVNIRYTLPLDESVVYLARDVVVPAKGTAPVSAAQNYFEAHYAWGEEECDFRREVQCDFTAGQGEHLGGKFTDIAIHNPECDECREEPVIEYGPWSDCDPLVVATTGDNGPACQRTRTVTTIFCDQGRRVVVEVEPCECECVEDPEPVSIERVFTPSGEWSECAATPNRPADCKRFRSGILTITRTFSCGRVEITEREHRQSEACECPSGCVIPEAGTTISFEGAGDCETECEAFGDYQCSDDETADFWICKAGTDRIAEHEFPDGDTCRNGKDVSHVRACVCEVED